MTPEEERQNQALLGSYKSGMQAEPMPEALPQYYQDLASQALKDEPALLPPVQAAAQVPAKPAPQAGYEQDQGPVYQEESTGSKILHSLSSLPGLIKSYGAMQSARSLHSGSGAQPAFDRLQQEGTSEIAKAAETERQRRNQSLASQRQAYLDKQAAQDRNRRLAREQAQDQWDAETRDPNSTKSRDLRAEIRQAYPELAQSMGQDFDRMSVYDFAHTPHPGLDKSKQDARDEQTLRLLGVRGQQAREAVEQRNAGAQELEQTRHSGRMEEIEQRAKFKSPGKSKAGGAGAGTGQPQDVTDLLAALAKEYGGEDKIPPTMVQQVQQAAQIANADRRHAALTSVMKGGHATRVGDTAKTENQAAAYGKTAEPAEAALAWSTNVRKELRANGIDPDHYQGQDIPGYGRLGSLVPDQLTSARGQRMRAAVEGEVAGLILSLSGKQSNESERAVLHKVAGVIKGGAPENVIWGLHQLEAVAKAQRARAQASHPAGAGAAGSGSIRVRDPKSGKTGTYSGSAQEAKAAGYEVL